MNVADTIVHDDNPSLTPIVVIHAADAQRAISRLDARSRAWLAANDFKATAGNHIVVPDDNGALASVVVCIEDRHDPYGLAALPFAVPRAAYRLDTSLGDCDDYSAALAWGLGAYEFARYKRARTPSSLALPPSAAVARARKTLLAISLTRDLVNTPAEDMGPDQLEAEARKLAHEFRARSNVVAGDALLEHNFPAIHAVGRASHRAPRLIVLEWGDASHPLVALVGKGVCFDTGGLDIKTADGMRQMKKDMGGAAHALGVARLVMDLNLPVRLLVLLPAVENAIAGNAYRPGDIVATRKGLHIEIGNTDAEGRVILSDALTYASESKPALIIDFATLTGAARVALGPELPATFSNDDNWFAKLDAASKATRDPLWRMPLWQPYNTMIKSQIGDIVNTGGPQAGPITAALFLEHFVPRTQAWFHIDLFAWTPKAKPGRPEGGEAQTLRAVVAMLEAAYPQSATS
jgi:leucyl aminopeptidase